MEDCLEVSCSPSWVWIFKEKTDLDQDMMGILLSHKFPDHSLLLQKSPCRLASTASNVEEEASEDRDEVGAHSPEVQLVISFLMLLLTLKIALGVREYRRGKNLSVLGCQRVQGINGGDRK